jgi:predicted RNase H-like HicB family nuclease
MSRYLIVIEETETGYSAYSPDLDGCVATGTTRAEVEKMMKEAIEFHLDGLRAENLPIPKPHSFSTYLEVSA